MLCHLRISDVVAGELIGIVERQAQPRRPEWLIQSALRMEKPQLEGVRDVGDRGLRAHAVAGVVQRR